MSTEREDFAGVLQAVQRPVLLVISAPSGGGKSTLCTRLLLAGLPMVYSVSCTTRSPRGDEIDGVHYHFLSAPEFERRVRAGEFLEHAVVHGQRYGTLQAPVRSALAAGQDALLDIDVQGARQIRQHVLALAAADALRRAFVDIFIVPPSLAILRARLDRRNTDAPKSIARRLRNAAQEIRCWREYKYLIVNDQLDEAYRQLECVVRAEHCRIV